MAVTKIQKARLEANLCIQCGLQPPKPGRQRCLMCAGARGIKEKALRAQRIAQTLCPYCGESPTPPYKTCEKCRNKLDKTTLYAQRAKLELCTRCGKNRAKPGQLCKVCINAKRERRKMLISQGLCPNCGQRPRSESDLRCVDCVEGRKPKEKIVIQNRTNATRSKLRQYKIDNGCKDCGYSGHHAGLEFDHRTDEVKYDNISNMQKLAWDNIRLQEELAKCDVVCATCHNIREYKRNHPGEE